MEFLTKTLQLLTEVVNQFGVSVNKESWLILTLIMTAIYAFPDAAKYAVEVAKTSEQKEVANKNYQFALMVKKSSPKFLFIFIIASHFVIVGVKMLINLI